VLEANTDWLENCHTWVQRAFPNYEPSESVSGTPVLDDETLRWIKQYNVAIALKLTFKFLSHYNNIFITRPSDIFHNNKRVTRLIKFLVMLECKTEACVVLVYCQKILETLLEETLISNTLYYSTMDYWKEALNYENS
jgi:hypothetical protein